MPLLAEPVSDARARDAAREDILRARRRHGAQREVTAPRVAGDADAAGGVDAFEGAQVLGGCDAVVQVGDAAACWSKAAASATSGLRRQAVWLDGYGSS